MNNKQIEKGEKISEDKYSEHWSLDGHCYVQVPKWVVEQIRREAKAEERKFIENVLDGVEEANRQMGLESGTTTIRLALKSRIIK